MRWPGAPYLSYVDSKFHARLLAMTRLGILPIEIETGRWHCIPREQRVCSLGCGKIGDTKHFLHGCAYIEAEQIDALNHYAPTNYDAENPLRHWRNIARRLERRWRERTHKLRRATDEPKNPADACDDEFATEIDSAAMQHISREDIRLYCKPK